MFVTFFSMYSHLSRNLCRSPSYFQEPRTSKTRVRVYLMCCLIFKTCFLSYVVLLPPLLVVKYPLKSLPQDSLRSTSVCKIVVGGSRGFLLLYPSTVPLVSHNIFLSLIMFGLTRERLKVVKKKKDISLLNRQFI